MNRYVRLAFGWLVAFLGGRLVGELVSFQNPDFGDYFGRQKLYAWAMERPFWLSLVRCSKCVGWWARIPIAIAAMPAPRLLTVPFALLTGYEADRQWHKYEFDKALIDTEGRSL